MRLDVAGFFNSISCKLVRKAWLELGLDPNGASLLTRLTTFAGHLPQGAPTSSPLAELVLRPVDEALALAARSRGITYTRYCDDLYFSGVHPQPIIGVAIAALRTLGLRVNRGKFAIMPASRRQVVTGYTVNHPNGPSVPRPYRRDTRQLIRQQLRSPSNTGSVQSLQGRIGYIAQGNPGAAGRAARLLGTVAGHDARPS